MTIILSIAISALTILLCLTLASRRNSERKYGLLASEKNLLEQRVIEQNVKIASLIMIDPFTGLKNANYFRLRMEEEIELDYCFSFVLIDIIEMDDVECISRTDKFNATPGCRPDRQLWRARFIGHV